jgi:Ca2+-binding RTX toxin-like protein
MRSRTLLSAMIAAVALLAAPQAAFAALDVTSNGSGGVRVASTGDVAESVVVDRNSVGQLRVVDTSGAPVTSSDAACAADPEQPTAVACTLAAGAAVAVDLGTQNDRLDTTLATGVALTVSGGAGTDTLRVGSSGTTTVTDPTTSDVIDLSAATSAVTIGYAAAPVYRLVASCGGCAPAWNVRLPASVGRVLLGPGDDRVNLAAWRTYGLSTFLLGDGVDRFFGSPTHRASIDAGAGNDQLLSRAAADILNAGAGNDHIADFGGIGDVIRGGAGTDVMSSLDDRRDVIDGQGGLDMCLSFSRETNRCDTGTVRGFEYAYYFPTRTERLILQAVGIRG